PESIAKLQAHIEDIRKKNQFNDLESYGTWLKNSPEYKILFDRNFKDAWDGAVDGVYGTSFFSGIPFGVDAVGSWFGGKSPKEYFKDATNKIDTSYTDALDKLIKQAATGDNKEAQTNAVMALLWIIVRNGADMPIRWRKYTVDQACCAFLDLSKQGCKVRNSAVKHAIEHMLMHQPDLDPPELKMVFLYAALNLAKADKDSNDKDQGMSKEELAKVCYAAYKAQNGWPDKAADPKKYENELKFRKSLLDVIAYDCGDNSAVELIEAISVADEKSTEITEHCTDLVRWLRDGVLRNIVVASKEPDKTATAEERRDAILTNTQDPNKSTEDCVRAIAKAVEGYEWFKKGNEAQDELLRAALRKANDDPRVRIKMIASRYLMRFGDGADIVTGSETLYGITQTPYKYGDSHRSLKYYKEEAQLLLDGF
ncbi:MAG TPA: hypothetical protein VFA15_03025, partial [Nitrososphaera sp.]|nr:hypothetical protein [Nitrososphaera sp.]